LQPHQNFLSARGSHNTSWRKIISSSSLKKIVSLYKGPPTKKKLCFFPPHHRGFLKKGFNPPGLPEFQTPLMSSPKIFKKKRPYKIFKNSPSLPPWWNPQGELFPKFEKGFPKERMRIIKSIWREPTSL